MKYQTPNFFRVPIFSTRKTEFQLAFYEFASMSFEPWNFRPLWFLLSVSQYVHWVNTICMHTKPFCVSSSNSTDMLTMTKRCPCVMNTIATRENKNKIISKLFCIVDRVCFKYCLTISHIWKSATRTFELQFLRSVPCESHTCITRTLISHGLGFNGSWPTFHCS